MNWNEVFEYRDGALYAKVRRGTVMPGEAVGSPTKSGYLKFMHNYRAALVHRVVWEMHHGPIPAGMTVDHVDQDPGNNRIENLRLATPSQQNMNRGAVSAEYKNIGRKVVSGIQYYRVQVKAAGRVVDRCFRELQDAVDFAAITRERLHGDFACHASR